MGYGKFYPWMHGPRPRVPPTKTAAVVDKQGPGRRPCIFRKEATDPQGREELSMLRSLKDLERYTVRATDGDIGSVVNFLLDDERWIVRYLVVQAGGSLFLNGRMVLISPISFRQADWSTQYFHLALTMDKVKNSPSIDVDEPVSRQHERIYYRYYG